MKPIRERDKIKKAIYDPWAIQPKSSETDLITEKVIKPKKNKPKLMTIPSPEMN